MITKAWSCSGLPTPLWPSAGRGRRLRVAAAAIGSARRGVRRRAASACCWKWAPPYASAMILIGLRVRHAAGGGPPLALAIILIGLAVLWPAAAEVAGGRYGRASAGGCGGDRQR